MTLLRNEKKRNLIKTGTEGDGKLGLDLYQLPEPEHNGF